MHIVFRAQQFLTGNSNAVRELERDSEIKFHLLVIQIFIETIWMLSTVLWNLEHCLRVTMTSVTVHVMLKFYIECSRYCCCNGLG